VDKGINIIDVARFLPEETALDTLLDRFLEYTEKDITNLHLRDDVMALSVGYQTVRVFGMLSEVLKQDCFKDLTGQELSAIVNHSIDYFNMRVRGEI